jgi:hypothetical protein
MNLAKPLRSSESSAAATLGANLRRLVLLGVVPLACGGRVQGPLLPSEILDAGSAVEEPASEDDGAASPPADSPSYTRSVHPPRCELGKDDCVGPERCVELVPGGDTACIFSPTETTSCGGSALPAGSTCCSSRDCKKGGCYPEFVPFDNPCGTIMTGGGSSRNRCDECTSDADCPKGICPPPGGAGPSARKCIPAACRLDSDCNAMPGGTCRYYAHPCVCGYGMVCVYPGGCLSNEDCTGPEGPLCVILNGSTACAKTCP